MEIKGKIIVALPEMSGVSKSGNNWKKREYVLETQETYPRKVHFDFFGDRADQYPLSIGDDITLSFDIESREYNGRWFTSIRADGKLRKTEPHSLLPSHSRTCRMFLPLPLLTPCSQAAMRIFPSEPVHISLQRSALFNIFAR